MIEDPRGRVDYEEIGTGPTVVLVPGSCSTGAAWRPMMAAWNGRFRCVTTSLLGYGGTAERRDPKAPLAVVGDLFDIGFKSNAKNARLVIAEVRGRAERRPR